MARLLRGLALLHRWLGALFCFPFAVWFASGIVLVFVGFPGISQQERLERAVALDPQRVVLSLPEAARGIGFVPERIGLGMLADVPVWRFQRGADFAAVSAEDGQRVAPLSEALALRVGAAFLGPSAGAVQRHELLDEPDQWTPHVRPNGQLPVLRLFADDAAQTQVYVSLPRARVIQHTTSTSRGLAWIGAIPHWWYPIALRQHAAAWRQVVLVGAGLATLVCLLGLVLGLLRLRRQAHAELLRRWSPYADVWLRWHHLLGLAFGFLSLTWVFSGMLSLNPGGWSPGAEPSDEEISAFSGPATPLDQLALGAREALERCSRELSVKSLELVRVSGHPYWLCASISPASRLLDANAPQAMARSELPLAELTRAARAAVPAELLEASALESPGDAYVYPTHLDPDLAFPLVRFKFADGTWLYADPQAARLLRRYDARSRAERWLYTGLHRLDFGALYRKRWLWTSVICLLCSLGAAFSLTGIVIATRWLRRRYKPVSS